MTWETVFKIYETQVEGPNGCDVDVFAVWNIEKKKRVWGSFCYTEEQAETRARTEFRILQDKIVHDIILGAIDER